MKWKDEGNSGKRFFVLGRVRTRRNINVTSNEETNGFLGSFA